MFLSVRKNSDAVLAFIQTNTICRNVTYETVARELMLTAQLFDQLMQALWISEAAFSAVRSDLRWICKDAEYRVGDYRCGARHYELDLDELQAVSNALIAAKGQYPSETSQYLWRLHRKPIQTRFGSNYHTRDLRQTIRSSTNRLKDLAQQFREVAECESSQPLPVSVAQ